jgi:hypothetical protein
MASLDASIFAAASGFALVLVITIIVIVGIHREERYQTLANRSAPGAIAQLARLVLGRYVRREVERPDAEGQQDDDDEAYTPGRAPWPWD